MHRIGLSFDTIIPVSDILSLSDFIQNIFREFYSENKNAEASADLYFRLLLMKISDFCYAEQKSYDSVLFEQIKNIRVKIYENPQRDWSITEIAADLSISGSYFQHLYKTLFNKSVKKDIIAARLQYAEYLLFSTHYKISVIAQQCGYQNDVHFMRTFKENYGMTPTEYRKKNLYSLQKTKQAQERNPFCL